MVWRLVSGERRKEMWESAGLIGGADANASPMACGAGVDAVGGEAHSLQGEGSSGFHPIAHISSDGTSCPSPHD